ncbi:MAG TPA: hypothetical protein VMT85_17835 [Thermoanaerobaculia bacterium]|nr:hypothetical protein [Thermoanaerobaculia bacterium]
MKVLTGKVVDGRIEVPAGTVEEGSTVAVLVPEGEASFTLSSEEVEELQLSIDQASRGEVVDGWELLSELQA